MDNGRRTKAIICIGIVATTLAAYEPIRHNYFINYDDRLYITNNPNVTDGITWPAVKWAFTKPYAANWHPLTWLSHMLDCEIYGLNPLGHHVTSVLIHTAGSMLLFWVLLRMTKAIWASAFVAAVFALHPVHVESVAWAAERKDVLSGLFWMLTMLAYVRYAERPDFKRYSLVLLAFVMGIMSKPMVVTLPFVLLLLDYWPLERTGSQNTKNTFQKASIGWLITEKIPLFALSAFSGAITLIVQRSGGAFATLWTAPAGYRIGNMFLSYIRYIGKTIWPSRLAVCYPHPRANLPIVPAAICAMLFVLMSILIIYIGRRKKYATMGWLWYVGTLVPVIGLVQVGAQGMANRYMYIPMLGLLIMGAWMVKNWVVNRPRLRIAAAVSAGIVLSSFVILTRMQVKRWQNSITLFAHTLKVTENNPLAENNYGCALYEAGRFDEAVPHLNSALRQIPTYTDAYANLGKIFLRQGKLNEAIEHFVEFIKLDEDSADVYYELGMALGLQENYDDAIKCFARTIKLNPKYPDIYKRMGTALLAMDRADEAIEYLNKSLLRNPYDVVVYSSISIAYIKTGNYEQAFKTWAETEELQRNSAYILNNPAWLIVTNRDVTADDANNAIEFTERACEMTGYNEPSLLDTLAAAYAAGGRFEDAVKTAQKAINVAKNHGQNELSWGIEKRIELYRSGRRYIQK